MILNINKGALMKKSFPMIPNVIAASFLLGSEFFFSLQQMVCEMFAYCDAPGALKECPDNSNSTIYRL